MVLEAEVSGCSSAAGAADDACPHRTTFCGQKGNQTTMEKWRTVCLVPQLGLYVHIMTYGATDNGRISVKKVCNPFYLQSSFVFNPNVQPWSAVSSLHRHPTRASRSESNTCARFHTPTRRQSEHNSVSHSDLNRVTFVYRSRQ